MTILYIHEHIEISRTDHQNSTLVKNIYYQHLSLLQYYEMHFDNLTKHSGFGEEIGCKCFHYGEKHINLIQIFPKTTIPTLTKQIG